MSKNRLTLFASFVGAEVVAGSDDNHPGMKRYQLGEVGTYKGIFGPIVISEPQFREAVRNFSANARGTIHPKTNKPAVHWDYSHDMAGPAAGWIHDLETDGGKLYGWSTWTPRAEQALKDEEFIGASMEIDFDYEDDSDKKWGTVLIGCALTNIPRIKNMEPIALDETSAQHQENTVTYAELLAEAKKLNAEDRAKLLSEVLTLDGKANLLSEHAIQATELATLKAAAAKGADETTKATMAKLSEDLAAEKAKNLRQAKEHQFSQLLADKKVVPAQKEAYLSGDMDAFMEAGKAATAANFTEAGQSPKPGEGQAADTPQKASAKLHELATAKELSEKKDYIDALNEVRIANPELAKLADQ